MKQYFTELEAAAAAGVSPDTIREFIALGVLKLHSADGNMNTAHLLRDELIAAFHTLKTVDSTETANEPQLTSAAPLTADGTVGTRVESGPMAETHPQTTAGGNSASQESAAEAARNTTEIQSDHCDVKQPIDNSATHSSHAAQANSAAVEGETLIEHRSFELLDLNRSLREQIEMLKQERDWLRKRVETLEVRSERDQLLLLSETKTVQRLLPAPKKSFWAFALPWLNEK